MLNHQTPLPLHFSALLSFSHHSQVRVSNIFCHKSISQLDHFQDISSSFYSFIHESNRMGSARATFMVQLV